MTHRGKAKKIREPRPEGGRFISPPAEGPRNYDEEPPVFCLRYLEENGFTQCTAQEHAALARTFFKLSRLCWKDLASIGRHKLGYELIPRKQISGLPATLTPDVTQLMVFRFEGMKAMIGVRRQSTFHIALLDRAFKAYDH